MTLQHFGKEYGNNASENYERFFVPAIGAPLANDLVDRANIQSGERVLDLACGTGIVARKAFEKTGETSFVAGLDINPGMLAVASDRSPSNIKWYEAKQSSHCKRGKEIVWQIFRIFFAYGKQSATNNFNNVNC